MFSAVNLEAELITALCQYDCNRAMLQAILMM